MKLTTTFLDRRSFLKTAGKCVTAVGLWPYIQEDPVCAAPPHSCKLNVLCIVLDDLNHWVGCLGRNPDVKTPNIDRLAKRGVLFTNAHCTAPGCNPSRASFLTGVRPSTSGIYDNFQPLRSKLPYAVTLPQHFSAHGYRVTGGGKIFHNIIPDPESWDEYFPYMVLNSLQDPHPPDDVDSLITQPNDLDTTAGLVDVPDDDLLDTKVARWAAEELAKNHDKPFFMGVGIFKPHQPWHVPRKYYDMYPLDKITLPPVNENDLDDLPLIGREIASRWQQDLLVRLGLWRNMVQGYLASISYADAQVGRVLDALDESRYADNTVVIFLGDNGYHLGEKLHWFKTTLWEEATRVPLIIAAPGKVKQGGRCGRPVSLLDLYPTLIELCGLSNRTELEGVSLAPLLRDPATVRERPAITTWMPNNHSVRSERWRYIQYNDGSEELYDHETDSLEWTNLAGNADYADIVAAHRAWLPQVNVPYQL